MADLVKLSEKLTLNLDNVLRIQFHNAGTARVTYPSAGEPGSSESGFNLGLEEAEQLKKILNARTTMQNRPG